ATKSSSSFVVVLVLEKRFFPALMNYREFASCRRLHLWPKPPKSRTRTKNARGTHRFLRVVVQRKRFLQELTKQTKVCLETASSLRLTSYLRFLRFLL